MSLIYSSNGTTDSLVKYTDSNRSRNINILLVFCIACSELINDLSGQLQKDYIHRKARSYFYGNIDYLPNRDDASYDKSFFENAANSINLQLLDFKCGRDIGSICAIVVNDIPDKFIMKFIGSNKIYGVDYIDKFKYEYIHIL